MSTSIDSVTIGSIEDRRIVLNNSQIAFKFDFESNWTSVICGFRLAVDDSVGIWSNSVFAMGLRSRCQTGLPSQLLGDPYTGINAEFRGKYYASTAGWTRNAGPPPYYSYGLLDYVQNTAASSSTDLDTYYVSADPSTARTAMVMVFTRSAPGSQSISCAFTSPNAGAAQRDMPLSVLQNAVNSGTIALARDAFNAELGGAYYVASSAPSKTVVEATYGGLDGFTFVWVPSLVSLHISEFLFKKLS